MTQPRHEVRPPDAPSATEEYVRLWPFLWFACEHPDRPLDEACLFDVHCQLCDAEYAMRGCPVQTLPRLSEDAPIFREVPL